MNAKALLLTLSLVLGASPLIAPSTASAKGHASPEAFPMKAPEFRKKIEARIDRVRAVIDKKLDGHGVSAERKAAIHRLIEEAAKEVRKRHPGTGIVILSQYDDPEYAIALLDEGAAGYAYLLKERVSYGNPLARANRDVATAR